MAVPYVRKANMLEDVPLEQGSRELLSLIALFK